MKETHVHVLEDGTVLEHTHGDQEHVHTHDGTHPHHHSHAQTKAVLNRLSRAIGHMESIKRMVAALPNRGDYRFPVSVPVSRSARNHCRA